MFDASTCNISTHPFSKSSEQRCKETVWDSIPVYITNHVSIIISNRGLDHEMYQGLSVMHCVNYWYLNFYHCSIEQHPLKEVGKTEVWNWNNLAILKGKLNYFWLDHSQKWIWKCLTFLWWKYDFWLVKMRIMYIKSRVMCLLTVILDVHWVGTVRALRNEPVDRYHYIIISSPQVPKSADFGFFLLKSADFGYYSLHRPRSHQNYILYINSHKWSKLPK